MARFAVWVAAYGAALWAVGRFAAGPPQLLWVVFWAASLAIVASYLYRWAKHYKHRFLWRLWRRLLVTYVFIAVVPVVSLFFLAGLGLYVLSGQFAAYLVGARIRHHYDNLHQFNRVVIYEAEQSPSLPAASLLDHLERVYRRGFAEQPGGQADLTVTMRLDARAAAVDARGRADREPLKAPAWLKGDQFAGVVVDRGELAMRVVDRCSTRAGELTLLISQPVTPQLLDRMGEGIGPVGVVMTRPTAAAAQPGESSVGVTTAEGEHTAAATIVSHSVEMPPARSWWDAEVLGASTLEPVQWEGESRQVLSAPVIIYVSSRLGQLTQKLFITLGRFAGVYVRLFWGVVVFILVIELLALVIGVRLTRSVTRTVDRLYEATERVKAGDFSYRTRLPARDQLTALGEAFDSTTASVEQLLRESQVKLRLEGEIEIAREVQRQLFPKEAPQVPGIDLYGACHAARSVSGDYYDFLPLDDHRVGIVLGDVSGKGISAALLMAAIQSALRAQFYDGWSTRGEGRFHPIATAEVVTRLNRQVHQSSPAEKYTTLFFSVFDARTRLLTYTNAGHLPPVLFRGRATERLRTGGTVVGLFAGAKYEQAELELRPGDLLLAFSDGFTEPQNAFEEEFGEERLLEVVQRAAGVSPQALVEEIERSLRDWTGSPELHDDMTLVLARVVE